MRTPAPKSIISTEDLGIIVDAIRSRPELNYCPVTFESDGNQWLLSSPRLRTIYPRYRVEVREIPPPAEEVTNAQSATKERRGMLVSCSLATMTAVGTAGAAIASGLSLGASAPIAIALWAGFLTSAAACGDSMYRFRETQVRPESDTLHRMDNDEAYAPYRIAQTTNSVIGVVSSVVVLPSAIKDLGKLNQIRKLGSSNLKPVAALGNRQLLRRFTVVRDGQVVAREFSKAATKAGQISGNLRFSDAQKVQILNTILNSIKGRIFAEGATLGAGLYDMYNNGKDLAKKSMDSMRELQIRIEIIENDPPPTSLLRTIR